MLLNHATRERTRRGKQNRGLAVAASFTVLALSAVFRIADGQELTVVDSSPNRNGIRVPTDTTIAIHFDRPIDPDTITSSSISAFARGSGVVDGSFGLTNENRSVVLNPDHPFSAGELVTVVLSHELMAADGSPMRDQGFTYQFWTATRRHAQLEFSEIASLSTNAGQSSRPYGGVATDLDNDGWLDITIVNEDTADLRVFMNRADGSVSYAPFNDPTYPVGNRASPSEAHDFNHDGNPDITVANINDNTVSVLLGNGDGTYAPQQLIRVGSTPRGIAVLDVDGDGDMDIVNSNFGSDNLSLLRNDGRGFFSGPSFFDGGVGGEWSLMAGDMNNDGISDLVVGGSNSREIRVLTGNGNGTFTPQPPQSAGGSTWQIMLGDVNGDGNLDVSTVNGRSDNGAIIFGNGDGTLAAPEIYDLKNLGPTGGNTWILATDLGDIDGDGDLDWVTSSFAGGRGSGDWLILLNDGTGVFDFFQEIDSPRAASCALIYDFDNDGDLDLGLIDEVADRLILVQNSGFSPLVAGDADQDLDVDQLDLVQVQVAGKYLTGQTATWGEGDWDGAPGGSPGSPPLGDGLFNQFDIISAQQGAVYLTGPYASVARGGTTGDRQTSVGYDSNTGELWVDAPAGVDLTSINIDSASGIFIGAVAQNLGGSFDNDSDSNIFKATFGSSFGSTSFGTVAQPGLSEDFLLNDLTVIGSLGGGGPLGDVDLIYVPVPEPSTTVLLLLGLVMMHGKTCRLTSCAIKPSHFSSWGSC